MCRPTIIPQNPDSDRYMVAQPILTIADLGDYDGVSLDMLINMLRENAGRADHEVLEEYNAYLVSAPAANYDMGKCATSVPAHTHSCPGDTRVRRLISLIMYAAFHRRLYDTAVRRRDPAGGAARSPIVASGSNVSLVVPKVCPMQKGCSRNIV